MKVLVKRSSKVVPNNPRCCHRSQRFCGEAGVKLGKVNKLFLTGTGAEEHAGLSGLILTLSALGSPVLEVFGPSGIDKLVVSLYSNHHHVCELYVCT